MKARIVSLTSFIIAFSVFFTSCKKESSEPDNTTEASTHSDDQSRFSNESDGVANDANLLLETTAGFTSRTGDVQSLICDASIVVDTLNNPRTITITYDGTPCLPGRTRTGVIVISMAQGVRWKNAGAQLNVSFQNFRVTRTSDNKSITINGTQTYTNVSGGLLINLPVLNTITHSITSSNMSITFDNGTQRNWQVARQRVFTYNNGVVVTVTGTHSEGGITGIAEWGTNRFGHAFTTAIVIPLVVRQDCSMRLVTGKVTHTNSVVTASVTFGLDATGNPTTCPGAGHYYMKIEWAGPGGNTHFVILPY